MDYRKILKCEFDKRTSLSPKYSLRDFAKDLKISPAHLSYVLRGLRGLSKDSGRRAAAALALHNVECRFFLILVAAKSARSKSAKNSARRALQNQSYTLKAAEHFTEFCAEPLDWHKQAEILIKRSPRINYHRMLRRLHACSLVP
jgi:uncharacterized protein (TIGR02147 family)